MLIGDFNTALAFLLKINISSDVRQQILLRIDATRRGNEVDAVDAEGQSKFDIHLRETLRVVGDALRLDQNPQYWADGRAPITAATALPKG